MKTRTSESATEESSSSIMQRMKSFIGFGSPASKTVSSAEQARERLKLILEYEGARGNRDKLDFLPKLKQELLEVIGKYGEIDLDTFQVRVDRHKDKNTPILEVEVNVALPE